MTNTTDNGPLTTDSFREIEARGALCVECLGALGEAEALVDRCGAALCRACASEFYAACGGCGRLTARDEAMVRPGAEALVCAECFAAPAEGAAPLPADEEVERLVLRYVELHAERKRLDEELDEIKEVLKRVAESRPRVANAVVLRAGAGGVRCGYAVRTTWDAERLAAAEGLLGADEFAALFERKVSFTPVRERLAEFLSGGDDSRAAARDLVRSAELATETTTLTVVAPRRKKGGDDHA